MLSEGNGGDHWKGEMEDLAAVLLELQKDLPADARRAVALAVLRARWASVAGDLLGARTRPDRIDSGGKLWVRIDPRIDPRELEAFAADMLERCWGAVGHGMVTAVSFEAAPDGGARTPPCPAPRAPAGASLPEEFGRGIRDPGLREIFRNTCARYLAAAEAPEGPRPVRRWNRDDETP